MLTAMSCVTCGAVLPATARFCPACGHRLDARADERRVVTVLFADVVGFTSLSETRDPEQVKALVDRCFQMLVTDIVGFGGRVDKIIGDAIVALFGAPDAHEDDAERAVRAALHMQQTLKERAADLDDLVQMRVGVNTGEVLVGALQAGGDYTAMGDVVNTAARLQTAAEPGGVLVGPATWNATRRTIAYERRGLLSAKGREAPVETFAPTITLGAPGDRTHRPDVPMVGRAAELSLLAQATDNAIAQSRAALVLVVGDAGMGKSRVAKEVTDGVIARDGAIAFHGRCVPYGEANVWWPVAEALRSGAHIEPSDRPDTVRAKLTDLVASRIGLESESPDVARLVPGLLQFLGIDESGRTVEPGRGHDEAVGALVAYLEASADLAPVVVQLSDLHWADDAVLDLGSALLERLSRRPFILVTTARRSLLEKWQPPAGRFDTVVVNLEPLDREASATLLRSLVDDPAQLTPEVEGALLDRGGGNPFFLEELVALLKERGGAPTVAAPYGGPLAQLPDTLRGLLTARLDRLGPPERQLIEDAAVFGRRGRVEWLRKTGEILRGSPDIDAALADVVRRDLLVVEGDVWSFRSDLLQEVAYHTLPKLDRARRHLGIAGWMERKHEGEWTDGQVDQLAHHYGLAAELSNELGGLREFSSDTSERALHWLEQASARAEQLRTLPVATRLYDEALTLVREDDIGRRVQLLLGRARVAAERRDLDRARDDVKQARQLAEESGDVKGEAASLLIEGDIEYKDGAIDASITLLDRAVARFETAGDPSGRADTLRIRAMAELFGGRYDDAERSALAALEAYVSVDDERNAAWASQSLAWIAMVTGRGSEAESWLDQALETFRRLGDTGGQAWSEGLLAYVRFTAGRTEEAQELQRRVLREARVGGDRWASAMMLMLGGLMSLWRGETADAVQQTSEAQALFSEVNDRFGMLRSAWSHGRALTMLGRVSEGIDVLREALAQASAVSGTDDYTLAQVALAGTAVQIGDPRTALDVLGIDLDTMPVRFEPPVQSTVYLDQLVTAGLAALQCDKPELALHWIVQAVEREKTLDGTLDAYVSSAYALALACSGQESEALAVAARSLGTARSTYSDRLTARMAMALAHARTGAIYEARRALNDAATEVDATEDRVARAVLRMLTTQVQSTLGIAGETAEDPGASTALDAMGLDATGWRDLFDKALSSAGAATPA